MLEQQDIQQIGQIVGEKLVGVEKNLGQRINAVDTRVAVVDNKISTVDFNFEGFIAIVNQGFADVQRAIEGTHKRIDKLYSMVDGFIALHQKLDQELTMLRAKVGRQEEEIQQIKMKLAMV